MNFRVLHYKTLDSTNNLAIHLAREGAGEGTVILSDYQTRGRGRFKRRWISPRGKGLLFSIILRPDLKRAQSAILTHVSAKSVAHVLKKHYGLTAAIKKPNDVLVNGRKIAGILTESSGYVERLEYVVIGIGINVNTPRQGLLKGATSIYAETGEEIEKEHLLGEVLMDLEGKYADLIGKRKGQRIETAQGT